MDAARRFTSYWVLLVAVTLPLYAADQVSKWLVFHRIGFEDGFVVIPNFFDLVHWHNTGAAFSMLSNKNAFFIGLSVVALIVLAGLAWRDLFRERLSRLAWALLLAGILGNLTDRIRYGYVIDFLLFDLHVPFAHPWPAFNVADSCICVAAGLFVIQSFYEQATTAKAAGETKCGE